MGQVTRRLMEKDIGGASEAKVSEDRVRLIDALNASKAAVKEKVVAELEDLHAANVDQKTGVQIIQSALKIYIWGDKQLREMSKMDNSDGNQTNGSEVAANDGSATIEDSSAAMIPPTGDKNLQTADNNSRNWIAQTPEEIGHGTSSKLPVAQFIRPNALDTLSPELRSLITWQSENVASKGKAPVMPDNDIMNINSPVGRGMSNNRKRKGGEVDADNNDWFPRRVVGSRASQPVTYHNYHYQKSTASINDNLMALHELVPGSQKKDMATTLGETADHLLQVRIRDQTLREEIKQLRQAMVMMHQSIQNFRQSPLGTPANMGGYTQFGGMGFRPPLQPSMNLFDLSISARMNMPVLLQWNSPAAASRLFVPPTVPGPSQQHRIGWDQVYNWTKKKPEYISIDDGGYSSRPAGIVSGSILLKKKVRGSVFSKSQVEVSRQLPRLDIRSERMDVDRMHSNVPDEEDDEFVTPRECFDSSGKKIARRPHNQKAVQKLRGEPRNHQNKIYIWGDKQLREMSKMDNSDGNQTNGSEVAANDGSATIEDSSAAMIPPTGDKNLQTADNNSRNWIAQTPGNNASQNILGNNLDPT
ncbi:hypothetical protein ACET3Z_028824 [Daucus carota]